MPGVQREPERQAVPVAPLDGAHVVHVLRARGEEEQAAGEGLHEGLPPGRVAEGGGVDGVAEPEGAAREVLSVAGVQVEDCGVVPEVGDGVGTVWGWVRGPRRPALGRESGHRVVR